MVRASTHPTMSTMPITLASIPSALETREGLPRPDWEIIAAWVEAHVAEAEYESTWSNLARDWCDTLAAALPSGYARSESDNFLMLANGDGKFAERQLAWCEHARRKILDTLPGVARDEGYNDGGYGKHVVFCFYTEEYYTYIADSSPEEGEFGGSSGTFIDRGYGHFVLQRIDGAATDRVIAHELNHALVRHLSLPIWLDEGLTQVMEDMIVETSYFQVDAEIVRRHRRYWNAKSIDTFWSGESFFSADEGQELSYHLAQVLFRNLMADYPRNILDFLAAADYSDAGNAALLKVCGVALESRVAQFLGAGDWSPGARYGEDRAKDPVDPSSPREQGRTQSKHPKFP